MIKITGKIEEINRVKIVNDKGFKSVLEKNRNEFCNFIATNNDNVSRRVFYASVIGLDWPKNKYCHVVVQLYYETHMAMDIPFATSKDAWEFIHSCGNIDNRIIKKESTKNGWKLTLKGKL